MHKYVLPLFGGDLRLTSNLIMLIKEATIYIIDWHIHIRRAFPQMHTNTNTNKCKSFSFFQKTFFFSFLSVKEEEIDRLMLMLRN